MKLLGSPRRMPSMAGYGLEVAGYIADAAERRSRTIDRMLDADKGKARPISTASDLRIGIVQARFNDEHHRRARRGLPRRTARARRRGRRTSTHVSVPGALEIPVALQALADEDGYDALVALGCVIRGETYHFELVANESGAGVTRVALDYQCRSPTRS